MTVEFGLFLPQMRMDPAGLVARAQAAEVAGFTVMAAWTTSRRRSHSTSRCTRR